MDEQISKPPSCLNRQGSSCEPPARTPHGATAHIQYPIPWGAPQVRQLQEVAAQLRTVYAGENAEAIVTKEQEMIRSWKELLSSCEDCRLQVTTTTDKIRFTSMVRDLISWMDTVICQIGTGEKPRDVSSVEVLMNYHQGLKSEIETRDRNVATCAELGKALVLKKSPAAEEIKAHLDKLMTKKKEMIDKWDRHWEWLQQSKELLIGGESGVGGV
uniref:Spectrin beta chain, non-erythrocytic 4 n=1 Tax=Sphaerodactylus townsendi TaxID=933632 RepID=A0ACB8FFA3_9SAUR